jgi:metal-responsive CopG/Arc/MetJ family transcriptional regulator
MLKTIEVTLDENLLDQVEQATRMLGIPRSQYIQQALRRTLQGPTLSELEQQHRAGYLRLPVQPGEFDVWETEQIWGDHEAG